MPIYSYVSLNDFGKRIKGKLHAANEIDLEERLKDQRLSLIEAKEIEEKRSKLSLTSVTLKDMIMMCIHLEQLDRAGVPLLESIADLRNSSENVAFKNLMTDIYESVKGGKMLSAAMAEHPTVFSNVFTGLIAAGEETGNLSDVFEHLAQHLKWVSDIRRKIKKAIYYPTFLLIVMGSVVALMMTFVVPKLSTFLEQQNFDLPGYTTALISTSKFFGDFWHLMLIGPIVTIIVIAGMTRISEPFAYFMDRVKISLPVLGPTIRKIELARFCHFFAITFRSGIGILECLDIANNVVNNRIIKESVMQVRIAVGEGSSMTDALKATNEFPSLVIRMFKVGEDTGNLENSLDNVNFFFDREVSDSVSSMVGVIQPALTIVMGGIMLWVSIAVFGPLYNSFSQMQF